MATKKSSKQTSGLRNGMIEDHASQSNSSGLILRDPGPLTIQVSADKVEYLDESIVKPVHYNSFNFSKLAASFGGMDMTLGVTSANQKEGKTVVACNMAVSLAKAYHKSTVIVDLNFHNPTIHKVFGTDPEPGVVEAIRNQTLQLAPTRVDHLFVLPAGNHRIHPVGIEHTLSLRHILRTLKDEFDFVIIDMCSVFPYHKFPIHFINEIDGLINVIDSDRTKKKSLDKMFKHVDEKRFVGYVFNNVRG